MDFAQALLCLVTFNSTSAIEVVPSSVAVGVAACQQKIQTRRALDMQQVDLNFHSRELKVPGEEGTMSAIGTGWTIE